MIRDQPFRSVHQGSSCLKKIPEMSQESNTRSPTHTINLKGCDVSTTLVPQPLDSWESTQSSPKLWCFS